MGVDEMGVIVPLGTFDGDLPASGNAAVTASDREMRDEAPLGPGTANDCGVRSARCFEPWGDYFRGRAMENVGRLVSRRCVAPWVVTDLPSGLLNLVDGCRLDELVCRLGP